jgi:hypothetical protein
MAPIGFLPLRLLHPTTMPPSHDTPVYVLDVSNI